MNGPGVNTITREEAVALMEAATPGPHAYTATRYGEGAVRVGRKTVVLSGLTIYDAALFATAPRLARTVVALHDRIAELEATLAAAAAEVAAFRGEDVNGWECGGDFYVPRDVDGVRPVVELHCDGVKWLPQVYSAEDDVAWCGEPTEGILVAMREAKRAAFTFGWTPREAMRAADAAVTP